MPSRPAAAASSGRACAAASAASTSCRIAGRKDVVEISGRAGAGPAERHPLRRTTIATAFLCSMVQLNAVQDAIEAAAYLFQIRAIAGRKFNRGGPPIAGFGERAMHRAPIDVPFQQRREIRYALPGGRVVLEREVFDVEL